MGEQIELVDEDDARIGKADADTVHKKQMLHHSVHIILVNSEGRFFCAHRDLQKKIYGGWWTVPGAHLLPGDSYDAAAKRLLETTFGFDCKLEEVGKIRVKDAYENEISMMYVAKSDAKFSVKPDQFDEGRFLTAKDAGVLAKNQKVTPYFLRAMEIRTKIPI